MQKQNAEIVLPKSISSSELKLFKAFLAAFLRSVVEIDQYQTESILPKIEFEALNCKFNTLDPRKCLKAFK